MSTIQEKRPSASRQTEERSGRGDRPVPGWMINLYSSTERWRENKDPRPVTSANLDLCGSGERVPCKSPPGPLLCLFFFFLGPSSLVWLWEQFCCFYLFVPGRCLQVSASREKSIFSVKSRHNNRSLPCDIKCGFKCFPAFP